ncbi:MAG: cyclic nucleotide-binding domain-containing protein [Alphaproteobacteria bacterium]|nr:cyclic nucleotide-binding domain-containing protein [Alphaproteobacteria bacterium]
MDEAQLEDRAVGALTNLVPGLDEGEVQRLLAATRPVSLPADFTLLNEGDITDQLYVVVKGTLRVSRNQGDVVIEIGELGPGEWVGELSVLDPGPTTATVRAVTHTELRTLSADRLRRLRDEDPKLAAKLLRELSREMAHRLRRSGGAVMTRVGDLVRLENPTAQARPGFWKRLASSLFGGHA